MEPMQQAGEEVKEQTEAQVPPVPHMPFHLFMKDFLIHYHDPNNPEKVSESSVGRAGAKKRKSVSESADAEGLKPSMSESVEHAGTEKWKSMSKSEKAPFKAAATKTLLDFLEYHKWRSPRQMGDEKIRMTLYTGGSWKGELTKHLKYRGRNVQKHVLEVPNNIVSLSELRKLVRSAAGMTKEEMKNFHITYPSTAVLTLGPGGKVLDKHEVGSSPQIRTDFQAWSFMESARMKVSRSEPVELHLEGKNVCNHLCI